MTESFSSLPRRPVKGGHHLAGPDASDFLTQFSHQSRPISAGLAIFFPQHQDHLLPGSLELIRNHRDPRNVIRHGHVSNTQPGKYPKVSRSRQIGAGKSTSPDLKLYSEKRVKYFRRVVTFGDVEVERARTLGADLFPIKLWYPGVSEFSSDLVDELHLLTRASDVGKRG